MGEAQGAEGKDDRPLSRRRGKAGYLLTRTVVAGVMGAAPHAHLSCVGVGVGVGVLEIIVCTNLLPAVAAVAAWLGGSGRQGRAGRAYALCSAWWGGGSSWWCLHFVVEGRGAFLSF